MHVDKINLLTVGIDASNSKFKKKINCSKSFQRTWNINSDNMYIFEPINVTLKFSRKFKMDHKYGTRTICTQHIYTERHEKYFF